MSSANIVVRIVGKKTHTLEFWVAEVPKGSDGSFQTNIGNDHPALALNIIAGANNHDNALAHELEGQDRFNPKWLEANTQTYIPEMDLAGRVPLLGSSEAVVEAVNRGATSDEQNAVILEQSPRALYRVTVSDETWIAHLEASQVFESTATSPLPPIHREPTNHLETVTVWDSILTLMEQQQSRGSFHIIRNNIHPPRWVTAGDFIDGEYKELPINNRIRELFLQCGGARLVYMNAGAPRFNSSKYPFVGGDKPLGASLAKMRVKGHAAGPFGFDLSFAGATRGSDGVLRTTLNSLASDNQVAFLDIEGTPFVRKGDALGQNIDADGADIEDYLRQVVEQSLNHIKTLAG